MDMDNTHVICKNEISLRNYCLFCFKQYEISYSGKNNSHNLACNFFKVIQKFDKSGTINLTNNGSKMIESLPSHLKDFVADAVHSVCNDCAIVIEKYVALNNELECVQLRIRWQIMQLHGIMRASRKVPSRVKEYEENIRRRNQFMEDGDKLSVKNVRLMIKEFRGKIFKTCNSILKVKRPLVKLHRLHHGDRVAPKDEEDLNDHSCSFQEIISEDIKSEEKFPVSSQPLSSNNTESIGELKNEGMDGNEGQIEIGMDGVRSLKSEQVDLCNLQEENPEYNEEEHDYHPLADSIDAIEDTKVVPGDDEIPQLPENKQNDKSAALGFRKRGNAIVKRKIIRLKKAGARRGKYSGITGRNAKRVDYVRFYDKKTGDVGRISSSSQNGQIGEAETSSETDNEDSGKPGVSPPTNQTSRSRNRNITSKTNPKMTHKCTFKSCKSRFTSKVRLEEHLLRHGDFRCNFCELSFDEVHKLVMHELNTHSDKHENLKIKCSRCSQQFMGLPLDTDTNVITGITDRMEGHYMTKHLGISTNLYKCNICGREYSHSKISLGKLRLHMKECHDIEGKDEGSIFRCEKCNAPFLTDYQRTMHIWKDHGLRYPCFRCDISFASRGKFRIHMQKHKSEGLFKCQLPDCGEIFCSQNSLNFHLVAHRGNANLLRCPIAGCDKTLLNDHGLRRHLETAHGDKPRVIKQYCDQCGKGFVGTLGVLKSRLEKHMQTHLHDGPSSWQFSCEICDKMCQTPFKLEEHMRTHKKAKPFACEHCGRTFSILYNLKRHIELVHKVPTIIKRKKLKVISIVSDDSSDGISVNSP